MDEGPYEAVSANCLIGSLSPADRANVISISSRECMNSGAVLHRAGQAADFVYFIETGIVSIRERHGLKHPVELTPLGREAMVGALTVVGNPASHYDAVVVTSGTALVAKRSDVRALMAASAGMTDQILMHVQAVISQITFTLISGMDTSVKTRLALRILMYHDRSGVDALPFTHSGLSEMLGVRRASVTVAIHNLESEGWIRAYRGSLLVRDRAGLETYCGELYRALQQRSFRMLGGVS